MKKRLSSVLSVEYDDLPISKQNLALAFLLGFFIGRLWMAYLRLAARFIERETAELEASKTRLRRGKDEVVAQYSSHCLGLRPDDEDQEASIILTCDRQSPSVISFGLPSETLQQYVIEA